MRKQSRWTKLKNKAPKVPDYTCPIIDDVLVKIEKFQNKDQVISPFQWKLIKKRMEQLRNDNDCLRESGIYWHDIAKSCIKNPKE
jgi:hypothetical protein